jgi:probable HAF family extracellular repeat protein
MNDNLGLLGGGGSNVSLAYDVNDNGQAVGVSDTGGLQGWPAHAFRTASNTPINPATDDLGTLGGEYSEARAINSIGQVTGLANLAGDANWHAFRTAPNAAINPATDDLGTLGGGSSVGRDINEAGVVVGEAQISGGEWQAFRTAANAAINPATDALGTLGGASSRATSVNSHGHVVGFSDTADGSRHAFVYKDGEGMIDLNSILDPSSSAGWVLVEARHIDDQGRIIGTGRFDNHSRAFVLIPGASGDVDGDGDVDLGDLTRLLGTFGLCSSDSGYLPGADFNSSGCIELGDLTTLLASFGT